MRVDSKILPELVIYTIVSGYIAGCFFYFFATKPYFFSISQLGANYPSKPFIQIGYAISTLPQIGHVLIWKLITSSWIITLVASLKVISIMLATFITVNDSPHAGFYAMLSSLVTIGWMVLLSFVYKTNPRVLRRRRILTMVYSISFVLSVHYLGVYLGQGKGQWKFAVLRIIAFAVDLIFTWQSRVDFNGIVFNVHVPTEYSEYRSKVGLV